MTLDDPIARLVRARDPDRFFTALFAPPEHGGALLTFYAFDGELARAREATSEPHLTLIRLHWWREVVEGARRRHEVATPLAHLIDTGRLAPAALSRIVDAHDVEAEPAIDTLEAWRTWLLEGPGGIAAAAAGLLGAPEPERFRPLGAAFGAARVLRGNPRLASFGRCRLPLDLLAEYGLSQEDAIAAPLSDGVLSVARRLIEEGERWLKEGPAAGRMPRAWVAAALPSVLARRDFRRGPGGKLGPRGLADRLAVTVAGLTGWL